MQGYQLFTLQILFFAHSQKCFCFVLVFLITSLPFSIVERILCHATETSRRNNSQKKLTIWKRFPQMTSKINKVPYLPAHWKCSGSLCDVRILDYVITQFEIRVQILMYLLCTSTSFDAVLTPLISDLVNKRSRRNFSAIS